MYYEVFFNGLSSIYISVTLRVYNSIANDSKQKHLIQNLTRFIGRDLRRKPKQETAKLYEPVWAKGVRVHTQLVDSQDCGAFLIYYFVKLLTVS
jgi:hypothetical protein